MATSSDEEVPVRLFAFLFGTTKREQHLERYVLREHRRGRALEEILEDAYVRNRSTPDQRARLVERPDVVAAIGENYRRSMRTGSTA